MEALPQILNGLGALLGALLGILLVVTMYCIALWFCIWAIRKKHLPGSWWALCALACLLGLIAGAYFTMFEYRPSEAVRVRGVPFPMVAFILENGQWVDYVSGLTPFLLVINFLLLAGTPLVVFCGILMFRIVSNQSGSRE